jgi:hypothetical protein
MTLCWMHILQLFKSLEIYSLRSFLLPLVSSNFELTGGNKKEQWEHVQLILERKKSTQYIEYVVDNKKFPNNSYTYH